MKLATIEISDAFTASNKPLHNSKIPEKYNISNCEIASVTFTITVCDSLCYHQHNVNRTTLLPVIPTKP